MITTCSKCGRGYEESSDETANDPDRLCMPCWYAFKVREAERSLELVQKARAEEAKRRRERSEKIEELCRLTQQLWTRRLVTPGKEFGELWDKIRLAWRELGFCENCETIGCGGECIEDER